jgi:uncharacterized protein
MRTRIGCPLAMLFGFLAAASFAQASSFDCAKARSSVEQMICSDHALSAYDERLNFEYKYMLELKRKEFPNESEFAAEQKEWLKETRNTCKDVQCLLNAYAERIDALAEQSEDDYSSIDSPVIVGCNESRGLLLIQAFNQSGQPYYETHGYKISELKWDDLLLYKNKTSNADTTYRQGSKTRVQSCGGFKIEIEYGYLNDDPMGHQGYERFPQISVKLGTKTIIRSLPLGYDSIVRICPEGNPMRLFVYSTQTETSPQAYVERTCFDEARNVNRRSVLIQK